VSVADTGIGMNDEVKSNLFTMFRGITERPNNLDDRQGSNSNTSGVGLGLTFCKQMIVRLGGQISFESVRN